MRDENISLSKLVCKLRALSCWKHTTQKAQLSAKLRYAEKVILPIIASVFHVELSTKLIVRLVRLISIQ